MNLFLACLAFVAVAIGANLACAQVPSQGRAEKAARNLGIEPKTVTRSPAWGVFGGCHENDVTKFTVSDGKRTVEVCAPILGGYTVRS